MGPSRLTTRTGQDEDDFVEMLGVSLNHNYWIQPLFFLVQISNSAFTGSLRLNPFVHDSLQTERSKNHVPRCSMKFHGISCTGAYNTQEARAFGIYITLQRLTEPWRRDYFEIESVCA